MENYGIRGARGPLTMPQQPQQQQNAQPSVGNQQRAGRNTARIQQTPRGPSIAELLTPYDFVNTNLPDTPSPSDFLQYLDKELSNGLNSWQRLMPSNHRLAHYQQFKENEVTGVPVGWPSDLAQYKSYVTHDLHIDKEITVDRYGVPRHYIYSITKKDKKKETSEVPMLPLEYSYQIIADCHLELDPQGEYIHLSRDKTYKKVSKISSTITKTVINGFIQCCPHQTCAGRRVKGTQHSADVAAKRKAESGPSINGQPKRKRTRCQSQEQEQHPPLPTQMRQPNNEGYQLQQLQQQPLPNLPMGQHDNGHVLGAPDMRECFRKMQQNEEYQRQQPQQPSFLNAADVQYYNNGNGFQQQYPPVPEVHQNNGDNFAVIQQPLNFQMEQDNNAYYPQPSLLGAPGYESYTHRSQLQQQQQQPLENIDPAILNNIDPTFLEDHSSNNQEQPQEAATTGDVPMDENDNGGEQLYSYEMKNPFEEDFLMDLDFEEVWAD